MSSNDDYDPLELHQIRRGRLSPSYVGGVGIYRGDLAEGLHMAIEESKVLVIQSLVERMVNAISYYTNSKAEGHR